MIYLYLFLQSNFLELPVYLMQKPAADRPLLQSRWHRILFISVMNSVTHPFIFFVVMNLPQTFIANILMAEAFAIGAEAFLLGKFWGLSWTRSFAVSTFANLLSWQIAPMLTYAIFQNG